METPIPLSELNKAVRHNMEPPAEAEMTGEVHTNSAGDRFPVYRETVPVEGRRPQRDADGNVLYHLRPDGSRHRPMMESFIQSVVSREYVIEPVGNGITQKNFNFRPTKDELERKRMEKEDREAQSELSRFLRDQGKTFGDLVGVLKGAFSRMPPEAAAPPVTPVAPQVPATPPAAAPASEPAAVVVTPPPVFVSGASQGFPKAHGPNKWKLSDDVIFDGKKDGAIEKQAELDKAAEAAFLAAQE